MSFLGKLKTAIKGNPVLREYEVGKHVASAGPALLWKVHDGIKKATKQEVSVFIFNKQTPELEKLHKKDREALFEMMKQGPTHLAKLRHPKILTIDHQVEESNDCIAFATEPVFTSLANALGHYDNLPSPLPLPIKEYQLHSIEVHYGLLQLMEALYFMHSQVNLIHGNINLGSVLISRHGDWKLFGFNFSIFTQYQTNRQNNYNFKEWNNKQLPLSPLLEFLAPEHIMSDSVDVQCDMYSFGMLIFAIFNGGKPLFACHNNTLTYKHNIEQISRISETAFGDTPPQLCSLVKSLLATEPSVRPDALEVTKHAYFEDVLVNGLQYIDKLVEKTDMERSQWFKNSLGRLLTKYPKRVLHQRILPGLATEFRNHKMIPFVLPLVLLIAEDCSVQEYNDLILPILIPAFTIYDPIQIPLIFLQKMDLLLKLTGPDLKKKHILPMILGSMEADSHQVQELCVSILPTFADMIDYTSMKHSIVPRITQLCLETGQNSVRVKCLLSIGKMMETFDKGIVLENILPVMYGLKSHEPGVLMGILGILHKTFITPTLGFSKEYVANVLLPYLIPLSMEPKLNVSQFNQFMLLIKELIKKIDSEQRKDLEQFAKMEEQTKSTVEFAREVSQAKHEEDAIKGIESLGKPGRDDDFIPAKYGTKLSSSTTAVVHTKGSGIFTGLSSGSTPTLSDKVTPNVTRKIDFSEARNETNTRSFSTWETPGNKEQPRSHSGGMGMNSSSSPRFQTSASSSMGMMQPTQTHSSSTSMGMGWSSDLTTPKSQTNMGMGIMQPTQTHSSSTSMGMGIMQPTQTHSNSANMGMGWSSDLTTPKSQTNMGMGIMQPTQTHSSSTSMGMGIMQPIQTHSNSANMGMGWSSDLMTPKSQTNMGMGIMQPTQTHSSSTSMGMGIMQPTQTHSNSANMGMGWSSDLTTPKTNMGMGIMQPSNGIGMGFDSNMGMGLQPATNMGMGLQPATNMGMGLQPANNMGMGLQPANNMGMGLQPANNMGMQPANNMGMGLSTNMGVLKPSPGPNPFADIDSLLS